MREMLQVLTLRYDPRWAGGLCHTGALAATCLLVFSAVHSQASPLSGTRRRFDSYRVT